MKEVTLFKLNERVEIVKGGLTITANITKVYKERGITVYIVNSSPYAGNQLTKIIQPIYNKA